ncbi:Sugar-binding cellulase-like protein [Planctomyces sp. SH-PL62]|nr:Sugar-binding cellulase-like protein [Planctomyces sp. SH-PL62]
MNEDIAMRRTRPTLAGILATAAIALAGATLGTPSRAEDGPWPVAKAAAWGEAHPWLVGCNYCPSTAINQLEMWQAETFDPATIDRELGWAHDLGFNSMRVFLHDIPYKQDPEGFLKRIDQFLEIAARHEIGAMIVLFDGVWDTDPKPGKQRDPKPGLHNSGWVQGPGRAILGDPARHDELKDYVVGVVGRFKDDPRVHAWDLFNEADNPNTNSYGSTELKDKRDRAWDLLRKTLAWIRPLDPSQPLTMGLWTGDLTDPAKLSPFNKFQIEQSDVITFHNYNPPAKMKADVDALKKYGRPVLCTEYMARPNGSRFDPLLGYLKAEKVGAYNWGFIDGKSQTIYPWDSWKKPYDGEPPVWFHDILRTNGQPYDQAEVDYIKSVTGAKK